MPIENILEQISETKPANQTIEKLKTLQQIRTNHIMALRFNSATIAVNRHYNDGNWRFTALSLTISQEMYETLLCNIKLLNNGITVIFFIDVGKAVAVIPLMEWDRLTRGED